MKYYFRVSVLRNMCLCVKEKKYCFTLYKHAFFKDKHHPCLTSDFHTTQWTFLQIIKATTHFTALTSLLNQCLSLWSDICSWAISLVFGTTAVKCVKPSACKWTLHYNGQALSCKHTTKVCTHWRMEGHQPVFRHDVAIQKHGGQYIFWSVNTLRVVGDKLNEILVQVVSLSFMRSSGGPTPRLMLSLQLLSLRLTELSTNHMPYGSTCPPPCFIVSLLCQWGSCRPTSASSMQNPEHTLTSGS